MAGELQSMNQYWKNFDLHTLQKELDSTATDLASRQDESDVSRKRLVEQSREFKKNTPEDVRKTVAPLLKSFQGEIDALSKRSKAAEAAFLSVYKKLIDVPDPVTVLDHALSLQKKAQRLSDLEIENKQLRETLEEYNSEFAEVKNQEFTIKQLKEKLKDYEEKMEATAQARASEKERELQRQFTEKEKTLQEKQMDIARKLGEQEQKVSQLKYALESSQSELFDVRQQYDELASAKASEMELMNGDLERANEKIATSQRETEKLRQQLASANQNLHQAEEMQKAPDMEQAIDIIKRSSLEVELAAKEKEIAQLVEDVQRLQSTISKIYDNGSSQVAKLEEDLQAKKVSLTILEEKLKTQEDYDEIKRELSVLKSIEYNQTSESPKDKPKTLEQLLLEKNRSLQTENMQLKVSKKDVSGTSGQNLSRMDMFASMIGQELALSYQLSKGLAHPSLQRPPSSPLPSSSSSNHHSPCSSSQSSPHGSLYKSYQSENRELDLSLPKSSKSQLENCSDTLDTAGVSLKIREILNVHNIGQRLFAKHVLGLSQGTVSELLSKPKHWDKLTEKGRESYRKMANWANDENNIMMLKSISPKKGGHSMLAGLKQEDSATEERICRILNEAQNAMKLKQSQEQIQASVIVNNIYQEQLDKITQEKACHTPNSQLPQSPRMEQENAHSISHDIVTRIYRDELLKLAENARSIGNMAESSLYQQELARLALNVQHKELTDARSESRSSRHHRDSHSKSPRGESAMRIKDEPVFNMNGHLSPGVGGDQTSRHAGSAFCLVRPKSNGAVGLDLTTSSTSSKSPDSASPLQRMQNIANSILSKSQTILPMSAKPLKAVLPPITQEQFDKYVTIDTDKLVAQVKECLSQYSISQRLFGECVLGLSQGSVSDLLARPKPWNMLTQKGREPFIRMKIFLEDEDIIQRLVTNQYRMGPDKYSRPAVACSPSPGIVEESRSSITPNRSSSRSDTPGSNRATGHEHSLYDMALMTHDLDTLSITSSIKEVLQFHNVGQKLFGEVILGLSQGSVSELLSKPKPWPMLSLKGREPFVKMHWWLQDPVNIDRLKMYQCEMKERFEALQKQYTETVATVQEQKQLICQLEEDLRSVNALSSMFRGDAEGEPSQSTEIVAEAVKEVTSATNPGAADSLLPIVQSQRERYRVRVQELEVQCMTQLQQQQLQQNELDKLRSDNVKLYEKIKFLQSYPTGKGGRQNDNAESRYATDYEERLDPFQTFSKKERMRKYANLKVHDKITLSMGRFVMGSKIGRTFAFFYTLLLHCLVFMVLYKLAYTESCRRDVAIDYHQKFAEHMHQVHGDQSFNGSH